MNVYFILSLLTGGLKPIIFHITLTNATTQRRKFNISTQITHSCVYIYIPQKQEEVQELAPVPLPPTPSFR